MAEPTSSLTLGTLLASAWVAQAAGITGAQFILGTGCVMAGATAKSCSRIGIALEDETRKISVGRELARYSVNFGLAPFLSGLSWGIAKWLFKEPSDIPVYVIQGILGFGGPVLIQQVMSLADDFLLSKLGKWLQNKKD